MHPIPVNIQQNPFFIFDSYTAVNKLSINFNIYHSFNHGFIILVQKIIFFTFMNQATCFTHSGLCRVVFFPD